MRSSFTLIPVLPQKQLRQRAEGENPREKCVKAHPRFFDSKDATHSKEERQIALPVSNLLRYDNQEKHPSHPTSPADT